jgi:hemin uptake protein HemP
MKDSAKTKQESGFSSKAGNNESKPKVYESPQLFGEHNEIQINHAGTIYRIRITRNGKLIMNK